MPNRSPGNESRSGLLDDAGQSGPHRAIRNQFSRIEETPSGLERRDMLMALSATVMSTFAGCSDLGEGLMAENGDSSDNTSSTDLDNAREAHIEYRENTPLPSTTVGLDYESIEVKEEREGEIVELNAEPAPDADGDLVLLTLPAIEAVDEIAQTFTAYWGAPVNAELLTTTTFEKEVTFRGGSGMYVAAASGTLTVADDTTSILAVRGGSVSIIKSLIKDFDKHLPDPTL